MTVLVTGAGRPAGIAVIRHLYAQGERVVAVDNETHPVDFALAVESHAVPCATDPRFVPALADIASKAGANVLVCTVTDEMSALHAAKRELSDSGLASWVPDPETVRNCNDERRVASAALAAGVLMPPTDFDGSTVSGPWIVKPRHGHRSRKVLTVDNDVDLTWALLRVSDPVVQTRLFGREFTIDALVDRDGELLAAIPRWGHETAGGISVSYETFFHREVREGARKLLVALGMRGVANVRGIITPSGQIVFIEVNPTFSGGLPLTLAAGADVVGEYVRIVRGEVARPDRLRFRPGVRVRR